MTCHYQARPDSLFPGLVDRFYCLLLFGIAHKGLAEAVLNQILDFVHRKVQFLVTNPELVEQGSLKENRVIGIDVYRNTAVVEGANRMVLCLLNDFLSKGI